MFDALRLTILIPATAALVTGVLFGLLVLALAAWLDWPVIWAAIAGAGAGLLAWLGWSARMAAILEYQLAPGLPKTQAALTQDAGPKTINLHIHREDEGGVIEGAFLDRLPVSNAGLANLANLVISGQSLTTSAMTASGLDRPTWEALRDRFISAGLLAWRSGNRQFGVEITHRGMIVFRQLAAPTPHRDERGN